MTRSKRSTASHSGFWRRSGWISSFLKRARSWQNAGARVEGERVRIGRDIIEHALTTPPAEFTIRARNPDHDMRLGGKWIAFARVGGPPNCSDLDPRGRRPGTLEDNGNFTKLGQFFNCIHTVGDGSVDAIDVHASVRHLEVMRNKVRYSDKGAVRLFDRTQSPARQAWKSCAYPAGISEEEFRREPSAYTVINTQLAVQAGRTHGDGHHRDGTPQPGLRGNAVHFGRCHGAGDAGRCTGRAEAEALACLALSQLARPCAASSMARSPPTST